MARRSARMVTLMATLLTAMALLAAGSMVGPATARASDGELTQLSAKTRDGLFKGMAKADGKAQKAAKKLAAANRRKPQSAAYKAGPVMSGSAPADNPDEPRLSVPVVKAKGKSVVVSAKVKWAPTKLRAAKHAGHNWGDVRLTVTEATGKKITRVKQVRLSKAADRHAHTVRFVLKGKAAAALLDTNSTGQLAPDAHQRVLVAASSYVDVDGDGDTDRTVGASRGADPAVTTLPATVPARVSAPVVGAENRQLTITNPAPSLGAGVYSVAPTIALTVDPVMCMLPDGDDGSSLSYFNAQVLEPGDSVSHYVASTGSGDMSALSSAGQEMQSDALDALSELDDRLTGYIDEVVLDAMFGEYAPFVGATMDAAEGFLAAYDSVLARW